MLRVVKYLKEQCEKDRYTFILEVILEDADQNHQVEITGIIITNYSLSKNELPAFKVTGLPFHPSRDDVTVSLL